jgi:hypothetical protein
MRRKVSICTLLVAISISAASAATAAPGIGSSPSNVGSAQKHERTHRPSLIQVIRYKVMSVVAEAKGAIAVSEARAAMAAKAKVAMAAKAKAANRNGATTEGQSLCDNDRSSSAGEQPSLVDGNRCR